MTPESSPARPARFPGPAARPVVWCLVAVLSFVALVELVVGRTNLVWRLHPGSDVGILLMLEDVVIQPNADPRVLVFGTSRARGAFLPTEIERRLGLGAARS